MTGGGKQLKNPKKSKYYLHKILSNIKYFPKDHETFRSANKGSILIEFAVCMPVLIILLYYVHDLSKLKRYYDQTEFVAQQMVNMIQNVSQKRGAANSTKLKITIKYLDHIHNLSWKTFYPGVTMFQKNSVFPLNHKPCTTVYYVECSNDGKASCIWKTWLVKDAADHIYYETETSKTTDRHISKVKFLTNTSPEKIHPTLRMNPNDKKIIIETSLERDPVGTQFGGISDKAAFGLYLATPEILDDGWSHLFYSTVIFTPKLGLFDETPPQ